jgi:hypothetical protein
MTKLSSADDGCGRRRLRTRVGADDGPDGGWRALMTDAVGSNYGRQTHVIACLKYVNTEEKGLLCLRPLINVDDNVHFALV